MNIIKKNKPQNILKSIRLFSLFLLLFTPVLVFSSVLSDLAANLAPGEFVELEIDGSVSTCQAVKPRYPTDRRPRACRRDAQGRPIDENGDLIPNPHPDGCFVVVPDDPGNILEFTDKATWDSIKKEIYIIGTRRPYKPWDQGFSKYLEATNSWVIMDQPPFGFGPHGYDHNAMDVVGRKFYQTQVDSASRVWSMDMETGVWQRILITPIQAGQFAALDYFPELDRMVYFNGLGQSEYALYKSDDNTWEGPISLAAAPFGAISHFSEYSPNHGVMFFGGGYIWNDETPEVNESRRFYMLDGDQLATRLADPPLALGQFGAGPVQTIDPNTGNLVVFQGEPNDGVCTSDELPIWEYDLATNTWGQTGTQRLSDLYCGMDTVAVPLYEYGVIFIVSVRGRTSCKVSLYRHSPMVPTPPSITTQPVSQNAEEGLPVTFSISVGGSGPLSYQWYRNNVIIAGAVNSRYTIEAVSVDDDGVDFHSTAVNNLGNVTSELARLTVTLDVTVPEIAGASVRDLNSVQIQFSEAVTSESAQLASNYQISGGIQVIAASLNSDGKTVQLQTDNLVTDTVYTVTINNILDTSSSANEILPDSSIDIQLAPVMNFDNGLLPFEWIPLTLSRWSVVADSANNALFLNTTTYLPLSGDRLGEYILSPDSYDDFTLTVEAKVNESASNGNADYALVFGFEDGENYFYMMFNRTETNTELFRVVNGNRVVLGAATSDWLTDDDYHTIAVSVASSAIEVRFDDNIVLNYTDQAAPIPTGKIGLGSFNDSAYFDDIRITSGINTIADLIFSNAFE